MEPKNEPEQQVADVPDASQGVGTTQHQSVNQFEAPQTQEPVRLKKTKKWLVPSLLGALVLSLGAAGFFAYQYFQSSKQPVQPSSTSVTKTPTPTIDPSANWKIISGKTYTLKIPETWEGVEEASEYFGGDRVVISNPSKTVRLTITPSQAPYGFAGDRQVSEKAIIYDMFGNMHEAKEITVNQEAVYVDSNFIQSGNPVYILFGTGYPAADHQNKSLEDYERDKNTILTILSTFKFTDQTTSTENWKTYSAEFIGLSIKYPETAELREPQLEASFSIHHINNVYGNQELQNGYSVSVMYSELYENITPIKERIEIVKKSTSETCSVTQTSTLNIDKQTVYVFRSNNCTYDTTWYFIESDNYQYEISATHNGDISKYQDITSKIIESIKFK